MKASTREKIRKYNETHGIEETKRQFPFFPIEAILESESSGPTDESIRSTIQAMGREYALDRYSNVVERVNWIADRLEKEAAEQIAKTDWDKVHQRLIERTQKDPNIWN